MSIIIVKSCIETIYGPMGCKGLKIANSERCMVRAFDHISDTKVYTIMYDLINKRAYLNISYDINDTLILFHARF